jgi:low affinity Fe/Cu permease
MGALLQPTQNRDAQSVHRELNDLTRALRGTRNNFLDPEGLSENELEALPKQSAALQKRAKAKAQIRDQMIDMTDARHFVISAAPLN